MQNAFCHNIFDPATKHWTGVRIINAQRVVKQRHIFDLSQMTNWHYHIFSNHNSHKPTANIRISKTSSNIDLFVRTHRNMYSLNEYTRNIYECKWFAINATKRHDTLFQMKSKNKFLLFMLKAIVFYNWIKVGSQFYENIYWE